MSEWWGIAKGPNWCFGTTTKQFQGAFTSGRPCIYIPEGLNRIGGDGFTVEGSGTTNRGFVNFFNKKK